MSDSKNDQSPCHICGERAYHWGYVQGHYPLKFKDGNASWLEKSTVFGGLSITARRCDTCGNIQLFAAKDS